MGQPDSPKAIKRLLRCSTEQIGRLESEIKECFRRSDKHASEDLIDKAYKFMKSGGVECHAILSGEGEYPLPVGFVILRRAVDVYDIVSIISYEHIPDEDWTSLFEEFGKLCSASGVARVTAKTDNPRVAHLLTLCGFAAIQTVYQRVI